jgi:MoaA/NifB/PqqE/SkfB family radical SAM enzyme
MFDNGIPRIVSDQLLGLLGKISNKNLLRMIEVLERFTANDWHKRGIANIKKAIAEDHAGITAVRRTLAKASPQTRSSIVNNLILGGLLGGYKKRYAFWTEHQVAPPGTLIISPTLRCNLRCFGCYAATHERKNELTREEVTRVITEAGEAGTNFVLFLGGEPLMVPWLLDVMEAFPKMAFLLFTNGLLFDDEKIARVARMGNVAVSIGIDGLAEETDRRKGPGAFDGAVGALRKLSDAGVFVGYSTMISRQNFDEVYSDAFLDTMIEAGASFTWMPTTLPLGRACREHHLIPTPEQKSQIRGRLTEARRKKPLLFMDFYNDSVVTEGCGAGRLLIHVNANGDVEPCILFPYAVDNIRDKSFVEIVKSPFFAGLRRITAPRDGERQTCVLVQKPKEVLDLVAACGAAPTSEGIQEQLQELAHGQGA